MSPTSSVKGMVFIVLAAILWGTTGTSQALAPPESTPPVIGALRLWVGGSGLLLLSLLRQPAALLQVPLKLAVAAGVFVAAYQLSFFWGVSLTGVAVGTMVGIGSAPVFAGVIDTLFMGRKPDRKWYYATALALLGSATLLGSSGKIEINPLGVGLAAIAGLSYSLYTLLMKKLLVDRPADAVATVVFFIGALLLAPFLIGGDLSWILRPAGLAVVAHLGLLATALSYYLFCRGLENVPVATAVTLTLAEPFTAGVLGILVLGERIGPSGLLGLTLILSGLVLLALPTGRPLPLDSQRPT